MPQIKIEPIEFKPFIGSEDEFQKTVARFLDLKGIIWCHVPNGGQRNKVVAAKLKGMGTKRGVPDCLIFEPRGQFVGFAIELKVGSNTTSTDQKFWLDSFKKRGWKTLVSKSLDQVIYEVEKYLSEK